MELKKPNEHRTFLNGGGVSSKKIGDSQRKSTEPIHHWAFLEEIDAPMWVDLTLESISMDQDINGSWFEVVHPFHQLSSHHLMEFSMLSEGEANSDAHVRGPSSPRLPPSVSKSRGKHYKSRKLRGINQAVSVDKKHPIKKFGAKTSWAASGSSQVKPQIKTSFGDPKPFSSLKGKLVNDCSSVDTTRLNSLQSKPKNQDPKRTSSVKKSLVGESTLSDTINPYSSRNKPSFGVSENTSTLATCSTGKSISTSTNGGDPLRHEPSIGDSRTSHTVTSNAPQENSSFGDSESTSIMNAHFIDDNYFGGSKSSSKSKVSTGSESNPQDLHQMSDLSHQIFGQTSGLLSIVRMSLRRSYVTRQPARIEVKDKRQSKGRNSCSSKSSVGSSTKSGCNLKNPMLTTVMNKNRTRETQGTEVDQPTNNNRAKGTNVTNTSKEHHRSISKREEKAISGTSTCLKPSKPKVSYQSDRRKPLSLKMVQNSSSVDPKPKEFVADINKGKVNGHIFSSQKTGRNENNVGSMVWTEKASKHSSVGMETEVLSEPKGKAKARNKTKNPKNAIQKVYFR